MEPANITYSYTPSGWDQERFLALGGFTVVFLNYNKMKFIERSVKSALDQDFPLLEMFFMDDASKDGSGEEMERIVREYRGRHKITVIRNKANRGITGQWNLVSKLATGNWLGMFCGDDLSRSDRVTIVSNLIKRYPTLLGLCTNVYDEFIDDAFISENPFRTTRVIVESGVSDLMNIATHKTPIIGASAWWHRSLFRNVLPYAPLDDVLLRWVLQCARLDCADPCWLYDGAHKTVEYSVGSGVSTEMIVPTASMTDKRKLWLANYSANMRFAALMLRTWTAVLDYVRQNYNLSEVTEVAERLICKHTIVVGGQWKRLRAFLPSLSNGYLLFWLKTFTKELFGLKLASRLSSVLNG